MDVEQEPVFVFDGQRLPIPDLETFTLAESVILYDNTGMTLEDFMPDEELSEEAANAERESKGRHPGFLLTLLHVAYQRAHPKFSVQKVRALIGSANLIEVIEAIEGIPEDDAVPPSVESTSAPTASSRNASDDSSATSGNGSTNASDAPADGPPATGVLRSVMLPTSDRVTSPT